MRLLPTKEHPKLILGSQFVIALFLLSMIYNQSSLQKTTFLSLILAVTVYSSYHDDVHAVPVLMALVFVIMLSQKEGYQKILKPMTDVDVRCLDVKAAELIQLFDGDESAMRDAMIKTNVPGNLKVNDDNAPLIATYLLHHVNKINDTCKLPVSNRAQNNIIDPAQRSESNEPTVLGHVDQSLSLSPL